MEENLTPKPNHLKILCDNFEVGFGIICRQRDLEGKLSEQS